jgi:gluconate 2-dehydrogenase gamma chain
MDDTPLSRSTRAPSAKRLGRRATLRLLALTVTGAATAGTAAAAPSPREPAGGASTPQAAGPGRRGRAWSLRPIATGTTPRAFEAAEFAALASVVDLILPDTDTPGARTAGVHWYLDDVSRSDAAIAGRLRDGLRRLNARATTLHGRPFAELAVVQQTAVLATYAESPGGAVRLDSAAQPRVTGASPATDAITPDDRSFFSFIKAQTIDGYYKSEMGQIGELEWVGHEFNDTFPGVCSHPDPLTHPRPRWPRSRA